MYKQNFSSRLLCVLTALIISSVALFAQTPTVKHVVERGETLDDIAKHYNVTKEDIISLNPSAAQFVYVGMELTIPQKQVAQQTSVNAVPTTQTSVSNDGYARAESMGSGTSAGMADDEPKWGVQMELGYGFLKGKDNYTYEATAGVAYNITRDFYAGARIGYNSANYSSSSRAYGKYVNTTTNIHILRIPIEIGYKLYTEDRNFGIIPFAGFGFNVGLSGKIKNNSNIANVKDKKLKVGGKLAMDCVVGLRLNLWGFLISGGYHLPLNKKQEAWFGEDAYPMVSIGWIM